MSLLRLIVGFALGLVLWRFGAPFLTGIAWSLLGDLRLWLRISEDQIAARETWEHAASFLIVSSVLALLTAAVRAFLARRAIGVEEQKAALVSFPRRFLRAIPTYFLAGIVVNAVLHGVASLSGMVLASLYLASIVLAVTVTVVVAGFAAGLGDRPAERSAHAGRTARRAALAGSVAGVLWFQPLLASPGSAVAQLVAAEASIVASRGDAVDEAVAHGDEVLFAAASLSRQSTSSARLSKSPYDACARDFLDSRGKRAAAYRNGKRKLERWREGDGKIDKEQWALDAVVATCARILKEPSAYFARIIRNSIAHKRYWVDADVCVLDDEFAAPRGRPARGSTFVLARGSCRQGCATSST